MKPDTFDVKPLPTSIQLAKIYLHFHNKISLMKPDTYDFKPFPSSCYIYIFSTILSFSPFTFK